MKLNTLNTIIDDIILQLRNSTVSQSEDISRLQIEQWIHNYRALLIKQDIDKGRDINPSYVQRLSNIPIIKNQEFPGKDSYIADTVIPKTIDFHKRKGIVAVKDLYGNIIQLGNETQKNLQKHRKYTCADYIAYQIGDKLYIEGGDNMLSAVNIDIIAEDPTDLIDCFDPNGQYPAPAHIIPTIKDMIFTKELNIMPQMVTDKVNNSDNDVQNAVGRRR